MDDGWWEDWSRFTWRGSDPTIRRTRQSPIKRNQMTSQTARDLGGGGQRGVAWYLDASRFLHRGEVLTGAGPRRGEPICLVKGERLRDSWRRYRCAYQVFPHVESHHALPYRAKRNTQEAICSDSSSFCGRRDSSAFSNTKSTPLCSGSVLARQYRGIPPSTSCL